MTRLSRTPLVRSAARNLESLWPDRLPMLPGNRRNGTALGALAIGAIAGGAMAIGALAIGRLVIGRMAVGRLRVGKLEIDEMTVHLIRPPDSADRLAHYGPEDVATTPEKQHAKESLSSEPDRRASARPKRNRKRNGGMEPDSQSRE